MGEGFHVDTNCARALGCELRLFRNLASGFVKRCLSNLIYFIVRGRGPTHFLNHFFWFLVLGHTWEVWFFGFFFLELGLNFFPSDGLYTVMYIDSYMEAAAAAVCTWAGCVLFFFPQYLCCKEMIIKNFPGCVAAVLSCHGCIFLYLQELHAGFSLGLADGLLLLGAGSAGAEMLEEPWGSFSCCRGCAAPFAASKSSSSPPS